MYLEQITGPHSSCVFSLKIFTELFHKILLAHFIESLFHLCHFNLYYPYNSLHKRGCKIDAVLC